MRKLNRAIGLAALLPVLVFAVSALRVSQFRCLMTGVVADDPCCPSAAPSDEPAAPVGPVASAPDCCSHEVSVGAHPPSELPGGGSHHLVPTAALLVSLAAELPDDDAGGIRRTDDSPPPRPKAPLVLLKRSLLI